MFWGLFYYRNNWCGIYVNQLLDSLHQSVISFQCFNAVHWRMIQNFIFFGYKDLPQCLKCPLMCMLLKRHSPKILKILAPEPNTLPNIYATCPTNKCGVVELCKKVWQTCWQQSHFWLHEVFLLCFG